VAALNLSCRRRPPCTLEGLASIYKYIRCIYNFFGREITKYTVICGVNIRFWPTLHIRSEPGREPAVHAHLSLFKVTDVGHGASSLEADKSSTVHLLACCTTRCDGSTHTHTHTHTHPRTQTHTNKYTHAHTHTWVPEKHSRPAAHAGRELHAP